LGVALERERPEHGAGGKGPCDGLFVVELPNGLWRGMLRGRALKEDRSAVAGPEAAMDDEPVVGVERPHDGILFRHGNGGMMLSPAPQPRRAS
jgi:hypothetical protein